MKFRKVFILLIVAVFSAGLMVACDSSSPVNPSNDTETTIKTDLRTTSEFAALPPDCTAINFGLIHNTILRQTDDRVAANRAYYFSLTDPGKQDYLLRACAGVTADVFELLYIPNYRDFLEKMPERICRQTWDSRVQELYRNRKITDHELRYMENLSEILFIVPEEQMPGAIWDIYELARYDAWQEDELCAQACASVVYHSMQFARYEGFDDIYALQARPRINWVDVVRADVFGLIYAGPLGSAIASANEMMDQILSN